jgi:hypothetical protein
MLRLIVVLREIQDVLRIEAARKAVGLDELTVKDFCLEYETEVKSGRGPDIVFRRDGKITHVEPAKTTRIKRVSLLPKERKVKQYKQDGRRKTFAGFDAKPSSELPSAELERRLDLYRQRAEAGVDLFG